MVLHTTHTRADVEFNSWFALRLWPPRELADPLSGLLIHMGASGTWQDGDSLLAYFASQTQPDEVGHAVSAWSGHFMDLGLLESALAVTWESPDNQDWATAWRAHFVSFPVGKRLMVLPEWEPLSTAADRLPIRIRPGLGFGTGGHATTATCLEVLENHLATLPHPDRATILDVGTGSGILAIAAARLGCRKVTAFDNDPDAVQNARENAELNDVSETVRLFVGTTDAVQGQYDVVLANLLAHVIVELMPDLLRLTASGGRIILSGILNEQGDRVEAALAAHGLHVVEYLSRGMWLTILSRRESDPQD
ncbi:MAG: 50S ribosomal protein L11 methyltransferase [Nitrospirota bacterium]|nr:50S ribosomal protein L11 methyltransferase [Nitrospirota bacterium]